MFVRVTENDDFDVSSTGHEKSCLLLRDCVRKTELWDAPKSHSQFMSHEAAVDSPIKDAIEAVAAPVIRELESKLFGCYLVPWQLQLIETHVKDFGQRQINEQWHYDKTKHPTHKLFFYLSDVGEQDGPFQFLTTGGRPFVDPYFRRGYNTPENKKVNSATGRLGTSFLINTDVVHRRSIPTKNNRLALILAVRPVYKRLSHYIDKRWVGDYAKTWKLFNYKSLEYEKGLFSVVG